MVRLYRKIIIVKTTSTTFVVFPFKIHYGFVFSPVEVVCFTELFLLKSDSYDTPPPPPRPQQADVLTN